MFKHNDPLPGEGFVKECPLEVPYCGWLKHGNPPEDLQNVPRCGAKTRAGGACRQPAMKCGKCRLPGGKSTGSRTIEGKARQRAAVTKHGGYTAEEKQKTRWMMNALPDYQKELKEWQRNGGEGLEPML